MKIKSLLLGSAAALAMASGAQAADAIMAAQPEPVDYVRVCDAFGTGYFYIPGTETCLKFSGYVRENVQGGSLLGNNGGHSWNAGGRFAFNTDTKSNTELGVLHTYTQLRFDWSNGGTGIDGGLDDYSNSSDTKAYVKFAYIELGGFRVGKKESEFYDFSFYPHGYAGGVINDTIIGYGPGDAQEISYTYKGSNGLLAFIGVEDDNNGDHNSEWRPGVVGYVNDGSDDGDYIPDVLAGLGYNAGVWSVGVIGAYDSSLEEGAIKARADVQVGKVNAFIMGGWSSNGDETGERGCTAYSILSCGSNHYATWGGDWALWGGLSADLTQKVSANLQLSYDDDENFGAAGNLVFHLVPGFDVTTEVDYAKSGGEGIRYKEIGNGNDDDAWGGVVRFQRTF